jgi:hypothetical protein
MDLLLASLAGESIAIDALEILPSPSARVLRAKAKQKLVGSGKHGLDRIWLIVPEALAHDVLDLAEQNQVGLIGFDGTAIEKQERWKVHHLPRERVAQPREPRFVLFETVLKSLLRPRGRPSKEVRRR